MLDQLPTKILMVQSQITKTGENSSKFVLPPRRFSYCCRMAFICNITWKKLNVMYLEAPPSALLQKPAYKSLMWIRLLALVLLFYHKINMIS